MTAAEKLTMVKTILGGDAPDDSTISTYLDIAKAEILQWRYSFRAASMPSDVPAEYEMTQIHSVVNAMTQRGLEGQTSSGENGIQRTFKHADMVDYIRSNVIPLVKVL